MNKLITICVALAFTSSVAMAGTSTKAVKEIKEDKAPEVRVSCSVEVNGITYTASAGWLFTDAETAAEKCADKLADIVSSIQ